MLTAFSVGLLLGLRHAFDADHVAAVSTWVSRERSAWSAGWLGLCWGLGHSATVLAVGGGAIALQVALPDGFARVSELGVGLMLVGLGLANLAALRRGWQVGVPQRDRPAGRACARSGIVGVAHGLAGSAGVVLLASTAMPSPPAALVYLAAFGVGTAVAMAAFSMALVAPFLALGTPPALRTGLVAASGLLSLTVGAALLHRVGLVGGLLA